MSDIHAAADLDEDDAPAAGLVDDDAPETDEERMARARASGWRPLEEFNGDPQDWRDFDEFLEVGEREGPVMRRQNKILQRRVVSQSRELDELRLTQKQQADAIKELTRVARRADQRGYDRAMAELKARRDEAVEAGDRTAFDQIDAQIDTLRTEFEAREEPAPEPAPAKPQRDPAYATFESANPWLGTDPQLARAMLAHHQAVMTVNPTWSIARQLAEAKRRLVRDFPDRFDEGDLEPAPRPAAPDLREEVEPMSRGPRAPVVRPQGGAYRPARQRSGFDVIADPEERAQARNAYMQAKRADPDLTEAEYLALYQDPKADVLELRRQRKK